MDALDVVLLVAGGLFAGCVNTIAGGGSLLTVPLLVLVGVPGDVANGTNRVGILTSNVSAAEAFRRQGVSGLSRVVPVLVPVILGALVGSILISRVDAASFERAFGVLMVPLLLLSLRPPKIQAAVDPWSVRMAAVVFFGQYELGVDLGLKRGEALQAAPVLGPAVAEIRRQHHGPQFVLHDAERTTVVTGHPAP